MIIQQQKVLVVSKTIDLDCSAQDPFEIPQIDISMLMPNFPGSIFPLFGVRLSLKTNDKKDSPLEQYDFLFRACSLSVFLKDLGMIRRLETETNINPQDTLAEPYPIQAVSEDRISQVFVHQSRQYIRHPLQARRTLNPGWVEFDCQYHCM